MKVASFTQIRGSIPLIWSMKPSLKWSPPVMINEDDESSKLACEIHFRETKAMYGPQYLINLIDKKGSQLRIGTEFTKIHTSIKDKELSYIWFDFHGECKKMKWENLSKLVSAVDGKLKDWGHFIAEINYGFDHRQKFNEASHIKILSTQQGTFRTNCMDCLDRTNVVQGVFSR